MKIKTGMALCLLTVFLTFTSSGYAESVAGKDEIVEKLNFEFRNVGEYKGPESLTMEKEGRRGWWADYSFRLDKGYLTITYLENLGFRPDQNSEITVSEYNGTHVVQLWQVSGGNISPGEYKLQLTVRCNNNLPCISQEQEVLHRGDGKREEIRDVQSNKLSSLILYFNDEDKYKAVRDGLKKLVD